MKEAAERKQRNSSIELARIIAMLGVMMMHYNYAGMGGALKYVESKSANQCWLFAVESASIIAVDLFVMISGYFLSTTNKRSFFRVVELILQVVIFHAFVYLALVALGKEAFSLRTLIGRSLPTNYFIILYCVLYIISPYINLCIDKLSGERYRTLIIWLVAAFSVWNTGVCILESISGDAIAGLSTVGLKGSQEGYTIVNFILLYCLGAFIRKNGLKISSFKLLAAGIIVYLMIFAWSLAEELVINGSINAWNYDNPLVIGLTVIAFALILRKEFHNRVINELSGAALTCFLVHEPFLKLFDIEKMTKGNIAALAGHQILVAILLYLGSYVIYKAYQLTIGRVIGLLKPALNNVAVYREDEMK